MCWTGQVPHQIWPVLSDDWRPSLASGSHACSFEEGACGGGQTVAWKRNLRATQLPGFRRRNAKSRAGKWGRNGTVFRRSLGQGLMGFGAPRGREGGASTGWSGLARSEGGGRAAPLPRRGAALPGKGGTCPDRAFARVARPSVERERGGRPERSRKASAPPALLRRPPPPERARSRRGSGGTGAPGARSGVSPGVSGVPGQPAKERMDGLPSVGQPAQLQLVRAQGSAREAARGGIQPGGNGLPPRAPRRARFPPSLPSPPPPPPPPWPPRRRRVNAAARSGESRAQPGWRGGGGSEPDSPAGCGSGKPGVGGGEGGASLQPRTFRRRSRGTPLSPLPEGLGWVAGWAAGGGGGGGAPGHLPCSGMAPGRRAWRALAPIRGQWLRFGLAAPGLGSSNAGSGEGAIKPWGPALAKGSTSGSPCSPKTEAHQRAEVPRAVQPPWPPSLPGCLEGGVHPRKAGWPGSQEAAQGDPRELVRWEVV